MKEGVGEEMLAFRSASRWWLQNKPVKNFPWQSSTIENKSCQFPDFWGWLCHGKQHYAGRQAGRQADKPPRGFAQVPVLGVTQMTT